MREEEKEKKVGVGGRSPEDRVERGRKEEEWLKRSSGRCEIVCAKAVSPTVIFHHAHVHH